MICSKVKNLRFGAEVRARVNSPTELYVIDPKPGDLAMSRLKWR